MHENKNTMKLMTFLTNLCISDILHPFRLPVRLEYAADFAVVFSIRKLIMADFAFYE